ncbi:MAG TPA: tetratricopeptide repeat protein [Chthoniobacterales bacterium]|nr:tetratricopeptide repeat protein [Chthoniobacterales bacterium]
MGNRNRWTIAGTCAGLVALVWFVFGQTIRFPFINFDDPEYVYEVPEINSGLTFHNLKWAFTHWPSTNWFPLKNVSHMLEFSFFGSNPGAFHMTNLVLHGVSVVLLFLVLLRLTAGEAVGFPRDANSVRYRLSPPIYVWASAFVAAIFAIHPLRAESVVWIEERKDVLSGVFFMLTLAAYFHYTRKPLIGRYVAMLVLFAAGLLSKPMLVTTPVVLLLLDYWPLGRSHNSHVTCHMVGDRCSWPKLAIEKVPLLIVASVGAFLSSKGIASAHSAADQLPFRARLGNALVSYVVYIWQMIWPAKLGVFYAYPSNGLPVWQPIAAAVTLLAITLLVFALRKSRPYLLVGWLWYAVMMLPVIGIIQINLQAHADRYTYLPQIGLYIAIAWTVVGLLKTSNAERRTPDVERTTPHSAFDVRRWTLSAFFILTVGALAITARAQVSYWRDSEILWKHTIAVTKDNYFAHASLADLLMRRGRVPEAIEHSKEALRIRPGDANAENNLGLALLQTGNTKGSVEHLEKALEIDPGFMNAEVNLAWVLATSSEDSFRNGPRAVQLAEDVASRAGHPNAIVLRTLAAAYAEVGRFNDAIGVAQQGIEIAKATNNDGLVSDLEKSMAAFQQNKPIRSEH